MAPEGSTLPVFTPYSPGPHMPHTSSRRASTVLCSLLLVSTLVNVGRLHAAIVSSGDVSPDPNTVTPNQTLFIGSASVGAVTIDDGSVVESGAGWFGRYDGGVGTVTVDGAGSVWHSSRSITLGSYFSTGVGHLNIRNGGLVEATFTLSSSATVGHSINFDGGTLRVPNLYVDLSLLQGTGVVETDGWMLDGVYTITSLADLPSSLLLAEQPGQNVTVNVDWMSPMTTFGVNNGDVIVNNGTQITSYFDSFVGKAPGSVGMLEFSGAGTRWDFYDLLIGYVSQGKLTIVDGAVVSGSDVYLTQKSTGVATIDVTGAGSLWEVGYLSIADTGQATINIFSGGEVRSSNDAHLGASSGGAGVVNVSGAGSKFEVAQWMIVGGPGDGELHISNGGQVTTGDDVIIADNLGIFGTVTISDPNSQWNIGGDLTLASGQASLTVTNSGSVLVGGNLWLNSGSTIGATLADTADPLIDVAGNATLAGDLNIALAPGFALQPGQVFTLIDVVGTRSGFFSGIAQNAVVASFGGADLTISYFGGDGNDVVLMSMGLSGDYDYNGMVNGADFLLWQRGASPDPYSTADLQYWAANYGNPTALQSDATTVPEPAAAVLAAIAMTVLVRRRRS